MNRTKLYIASLSILMGVASFGASIDHIQNYTVEYGANPAQQGAINQSSTVYFNPAGLSRLETGLYVTGGLQYAFGKQTISNGEKYSADLNSPVPNFALYQVKDNGALFWTVGAVGGGASLNYKDGIPLSGAILGMSINSLLDTEVKGENRYFQTTFGKVWTLNDKWSTSAAIRGVYGIRKLEAKAHGAIPLVSKLNADIDSERTAKGVGFQLGINYAATDRLNIGMRYDSKVKLNFKTDSTISDNSPGKVISNTLINKYPVYRDSSIAGKTRRDLPALLALGASYKMTNRWTTYVGGNYYFNEEAKMDRLDGVEDYNNGWEFSLGSEYQLNDKWAWLVGGNIADTGAKPSHFAATEYALNSKMIATGFKYKQNDTTEWMVAYTHYFYDTKTYDGETYKKDIRSVGVGFTKKF